jgi:hypothetical protein
MNFETIEADALGRAMTGLTLNLLVPDVLREVAFLRDVLGLVPQRAEADFAIVPYAGAILLLHSDASYSAHPLHGLLPEAGARGAGIELRLHETDPDAAAGRADPAAVLSPPTDKTAHGLRETVILSPAGYAWVPSRRL